MGAFVMQGVSLPTAADVESYDAGEISAFPAVKPVTAMQVIERDGEFFYGGEIDVFVGNVLRALGGHRFVRFEVKSAAKETSPIKNGSHVVLSEHPYSLGWCHFEPFRAARFEAKSNFDTAQLETGGLEDALAYLARLDCDYWETGRFRTAGFTGIDNRLTWHGQQENRKNLLHVLGVCADAHRFHQQLMAHPKILKLLDETKQRTIHFGWPTGERIVVNPEVAEQGWELMNLAVRQALAGPHDDGEWWLKEQKPVCDKVAYIYRDLLNARNRAVVARLQREVRPPEEQ